MNKLYVATAITLATVSFASAQEGYNNMMRRNGGEAPRVQVQAQAQVRQNGNEDNQGYMMNNVQRMMTGSSTVSLQVQALNKEMEDKIKAIRDDYMARIRAIIGNARPATTTPPGMMEGEKRGADEGRKMGRPFVASTSTVDINTSEGNRPLPPQGFFDFFRSIFGGNR